MIKFAKVVYEVVCKTYSIRTYGEFFSDKPALFFFWHSKFFILPYVFRNTPVKVLISPSRDGDIISKFISLFGLGSIRSSYRKNRFAGISEIKKQASMGFNIAITPDGPLGPPGRFKRGTVSLIKKFNLRCVFVGVEYLSFWKLGTWDGFEIPMPFTKIIIYALEGYPENEMEAENMLNEASLIARSLF